MTIKVHITLTLYLKEFGIVGGFSEELTCVASDPDFCKKL